MAGDELRRTVGADEAGQRLGVVLAGWLGTSRSQAQALVADGLVTVDGRPAPKSHRVLLGEEVRVRPRPVVEPEPPPPVPIRWHDEHLSVVAKPADLVVHEGAGVRGATLVDALRAQGVPLAAGEDPTRPGIVHRLDRGTSGLLVVAHTDLAWARLKEAFARHDIHREYWALVEGHLDPPDASIEAPITRSVRNRTTFTTADHGRPAVTHYRTLAAHADTSEVAVTLETGRTHQVRVHFRAIGRPVAGDVAYGGSAELARRLGLARQALHARHLAFAHPVTGEPVEVDEPLPEELQRARALAAGGPVG